MGYHMGIGRSEMCRARLWLVVVLRARRLPRGCPVRRAPRVLGLCLMMHRVPARACAAAEGTGAGAKRGHAEAAAVGGGHDGGSEGEDMGPMPLGEAWAVGARCLCAIIL